MLKATASSGWWLPRGHGAPLPSVTLFWDGEVEVLSHRGGHISCRGLRKYSLGPLISAATALYPKAIAISHPLVCAN